MATFPITAVFYDSSGVVVMVVSTDEPAKLDTDPAFNRAEHARVIISHEEYLTVSPNLYGPRFANLELMRFTLAELEKQNPIISEKVKTTINMLDGEIADRGVELPPIWSDPIEGVY